MHSLCVCVPFKIADIKDPQRIKETIFRSKGECRKYKGMEMMNNENDKLYYY